MAEKKSEKWFLNERIEALQGQLESYIITSDKEKSLLDEIKSLKYKVSHLSKSI